MKTLLTIASLLVLAVPVALAAPPTGSDTKNAAKVCKAERGTTADDIEAFNKKHGTNKNKKNAFGQCVSGKAKDKTKGKEEEKDGEEQEAEAEATKMCKAERGTTAATIDAFNKRHGTNKNKKNAFGKCVSKHSKSG